MKKFQLSRRMVLRGSGAAIALPLLDAMLARRATAQELAPRKRFIVFFSPNGVPMTNWAPKGGETDFQLSPILAPLEPLRQKIIVLRGIDQKAGGAGDGHQNGMTGMLTAQVTNGGGFSGGCGQGGGWANGISVDQFIANEFAKTVKTKFKSLEFGAVCSTRTTGDNWNRMCYAGANQPLPPEENPTAAFNRIFGDLTANPADLDKVRLQRKSVLDAVMRQYGFVKRRLGAEDNRRLDKHFEAIREIEVRLQPGATGAVPAGGGGTCSKPSIDGAPMDIKNYDNLPVIGKLQMDMLAMALACDLTRVASLQWSSSSGSAMFRFLNVPRSHHDISHDGASNGTSLEYLTKINNWYAQQYAYLAGKLDSVQEPGGTILDSSLMFWCNELGNGAAHSTADAPYVLAGSAGGYYKTGRFLDFPGNVPHPGLLVSMINAMGIPATTFGRPDWNSGGPIPRIR
jgi:hypothetical protein